MARSEDLKEICRSRDRPPSPRQRGAVDLDGYHDLAVGMEDSYEINRPNGICENVHLHSRIHELPEIARTEGHLRFGGKMGRSFTFDAAIFPAGKCHHCRDGDLPVVLAYPRGGTYDKFTSVEDRSHALKTILKVPRKDAVYGSGGPLCKLWKRTT
jgi:uncharacterized protein YjlB